MAKPPTDVAPNASAESIAPAVAHDDAVGGVIEVGAAVGTEPHRGLPSAPRSLPGGANRFAGLDALRGLFVFMVLMSHAVTLAGPRRSGWLATPVSAFDVSVSGFFVLSGFLIYRPFARAHAMGVAPLAARVFWWRRAVRILPAYWVALTFFVVIGHIRPDSFTDLVSHYTLTNVYRPSALFGGISQGWTLTIEVTFYALVPILAWLVHRRVRGPVPLRREWWLIGLIYAGGHLFRLFVYSVDWYVGPAPLRGIAYLWVPTHLDFLAAGMALAVVSVAHEHRDSAFADRVVALASARWRVVAVGIAVWVLYAYTVGGTTVSNGFTFGHIQLRQIVYVVFGLAVIGPFALARPESSRSSAWQRVGWWAGALSYAAYLWHNDWMEIFADDLRRVPGRFPEWFGHGPGDANIAVLVVVGVVMGIGFALLSWFGVEKPTSRLRNLVSVGRRSAFENVSSRRRTGLALALLALVLLAPLIGLLHYQGPPMEEGFMLAFPMQLLDGRLPHRDFLHLYGPGSLWVLAGVFKVAGTTLTVERMVGFAQQAAMAVGVFALLRPWGRRLATLSGVVSVVVLIGPLGLSAMAWNGALAAGTCGLACLCAAARRLDDEQSPLSAHRLAVAGGVLLGIALLYRPDLVLAVGLGAGTIVAATPRLRRPILVAGGATVALYTPHVLLSGVSASFRGMFLEPVFELRGGRSLPVPPSWGHLDGFLQRAGALRTSSWALPMPTPSQQVFLWFVLVPVSALGSAVVAWRLRRSVRNGDAPDAVDRAAALWPAALFGVGLLTQALQRPDTAHLSWVSGYTFAVAVAAIAELGPIAHLPAPRRAWAAFAPVAALLVVVIPFYPLRTYVDLVGQSAGYNRFGYEIRRGDRVFYFGDQVGATSAQRVTDELSARSKPGERLVVGPVDLSRTAYSDAFFYYLFPELKVGTRYIEMDPGIADGPDSGLAEEMRQADWFIASDAWSAWDEPNDSRFAGSDEPNQVVRDRFCMVLDAGTFKLLHRCR